MAEPLEVVGPRAGSAPLTYTLVEQGVVDVQSVFAHFDGTAASGAYRPTVTVKSQNGTTVSRTFPAEELAAGDIADVTFAPLLRAGSTGGGSLATYDQLILATPTLEMYWECGEAAGVLVDSKGGEDMSPVGSPVYGVAGPMPPATAVSVNGTANYWAVTPSAPDNYFGSTHAFTIEGFIYVDPSISNNDPLFCFVSGPVQIDLGCTFASKRVSLQRGATQTPVTAAQAITTSTWHYIAGTYDGANLRCYLDGALIGGPTADVVNIGPVLGGIQAIGARGTPFTTYLTGRAANVAVYNTALSASDILLHYLRWQGVA